ncbi:hypothetical protein V7024_07430 [Bacillus sp. JJ864]|uniref:hypothetical protein n=1 Tax=Bacillus sp. JJ864 TaxID=3122975 RepID=UPI002FFDD404
MLKQDLILAKVMDKWAWMNQDSSFRKEYEAAKFVYARNKGGEEGIEHGKI